MTFITFLIALFNAFLVWQLVTFFKPQIKALGLKWTYHSQAFFEIHFWQIEDIKRRDLKKRSTLKIIEVEKNLVPDCWKWEVKVQDIERGHYTTTEIKVLESEN